MFPFPVLLLKRFTAFQDSTANGNTARGVHLQQNNARTTGRCLTDNFRAGEFEMDLPLVLSWVEQFNCLTTDFCRQVRPLGKITPVAGEREIGQFVGTSMLPGNDVLDMKRHISEFFRQSAIFATIAGTLPNETACSGVNHDAVSSGLGP